MESNVVEKDQLWQQLNAVIAHRSGQDQVLWSVFGIFWAANAILLVALFSNGQEPRGPAGVAVTLAGLAMAFVWWLIQRRAIGNVKRLTHLLQKLEEELGLPANLAMSPEINKADADRFMPSRPGATTVMSWTTAVAIPAWALLLGWVIRASVI